jgi:hypothetical protein
MVDLIEVCVIATSATIAVTVPLEEMYAQRHMIVRRRRRHRRNVFLRLHADCARVLKFEAGLGEEDIRKLQKILRSFGNKIGTPMFDASFVARA